MENRSLYLICGSALLALILVAVLNGRSDVDLPSVGSALAYDPPDPCSLEVVVCPDELVTGKASWYNYDLDGLPNYGANHLTAASRTLKRYSTHTVTNLANGKSVTVYINDYGPEAWTGREIDLSLAAFAQIADLRTGIIEVSIN